MHARLIINARGKLRPEQKTGKKAILHTRMAKMGKTGSPGEPRDKKEERAVTGLKEGKEETVATADPAGRTAAMVAQAEEVVMESRSESRSAKVFSGQ